MKKNKTIQKYYYRCSKCFHEFSEIQAVKFVKTVLPCCPLCSSSEVVRKYRLAKAR